MKCIVIYLQFSCICDSTERQCETFYLYISGQPYVHHSSEFNC